MSDGWEWQEPECTTDGFVKTKMQDNNVYDDVETAGLQENTQYA